MDGRPVIGVTMGDPLGIGPEVLVKALADPAVRRLAKFVVYGRNEALLAAAERSQVPLDWFRVDAASDRAQEGSVLAPLVLDYTAEGLLDGTRPGPTRFGGILSKAFVEDAITDAMRAPGDPRRIDAVVTGPTSKESWALGGFKWPGHTELLAVRTKAKRHATMFDSPRLRAPRAPAHLPRMDVLNVLTIGRLYDPNDLGHEFCRQLGIDTPRIAVCGLTPHAGENGMFGDEESRIIRPAIDAARRIGIDAHGPFPGDTIFIQAAAGDWDLVVAMYHDQGLIPVKLLGWDKAVNVTVGLPIVRTSPDHGTAFDIAGQGKASEGSMKAAIELA
ncbi:MAG: 4-hydroxythreonine-4-phosphate dehydrogenase PdxA, partial [Phycisphaerales bacterium]